MAAEWPVVRCEDLFNVTARIGWKGLAKRDFTSHGPYLITGVHFRRNGKVDWRACFHIPQWRYDESPEVMVRVHDVLITKDGTIGKVAYVDDLPGPAALNSHLFLVRPADNRILPRYAYYTFQSLRFRDFVVERGTGSTIVGLPWKTFRDFEVPVPPLPEQRKIAAILSAVDEVIEKTEAVIQSLHTLKKAMMQELLTRGLPGRNSRFKQTEIGEIPEEWKVLRVEQIGAVAYGLTVNAARRQSNNLRPYLTVANLQEHGLLLDPVKNIGVLDGDGDRYECRFGDVLIVEGNANPARVGHSAVWRDELPCALHQNHLIRIRPDLLQVEPDWLSTCINHPTGRVQIEAAAKTSSGLHTINSRVVSTLLVPIPPLAEQQEVIRHLAAIDARRRTEEDFASQTRGLKGAVMSALLTGELRVTPDEHAA